MLGKKRYVSFGKKKRKKTQGEKFEMEWNGVSRVFSAL